MHEMFPKEKMDNKFEKFILEANSEKENGNFESALLFYQKALELNPGSLEVSQNIGDILFQIQDFDKAKEFYKFIIENDIQNQPAYYKLGICLTKVNKLNESIVFFEKAYEIKSSCRDTALALARVNSNLQKNIEAKKFYELAISLDEKSPEVIIEASKFYNSILKQDKTLFLLEGLLKSNPNCVEANILLSETYVSLNKSDHALEILQSALKQSPLSSRLALAIGELYYLKNDYIEALNYFYLSLNHEPSKKALLYCARTLSLLDRDDESVDFYMKSLVFDPYCKEALFRVGVYFFQIQQYAECVKCLEKIVLQDENFNLQGQCYFLLGLANEQLNNINFAIENFEKSMECNYEIIACQQKLSILYR